MIISIFLGVICIIIQMVFVPQIENIYWRVIVMLFAALGYIISLCVAYDAYNKLQSRIKSLEDKTENNAENIHKLSKKQSNKIIEYSMDSEIN